MFRRLIEWLTDDEDLWNNAMDFPGWVHDSPCMCEEASYVRAPGDYTALCPRCGGRARYMAMHPTDVARREKA